MTTTGMWASGIMEIQVGIGMEIEAASADDGFRCLSLMCFCSSFASRVGIPSLLSGVAFSVSYSGGVHFLPSFISP